MTFLTLYYRSSSAIILDEMTKMIPFESSTYTYVKTSLNKDRGLTICLECASITYIYPF